ncbi:MAG: ABC-type phosphate/phosphonate transport system substrate-binding protein [Cellvibrionaceae bacterium]|jgi:ABC-type phosphate/phosphonate transport system substrate-binding protein
MQKINQFISIFGTFALLIAFSIACSPTSEVREVEVTRYQVLEVPIVATQLIEVTREIEVVTEVEVEVTREVEVILEPTVLGSPGSAGNPFQVIFLPTAAEALIEVRGGFLLDDLTEKTGYMFEAVILSSDAEVIDFVCERPTTSIAMLTPEQYVAAHERCNIFPVLSATQFGVPYQSGMLVSRTSSVINVFEDIAFKKVAVPSLDDVITYQLFAKEIEDGSLSGVEFVEYGTSSSALIALLEKEVDIAAAIFNPPSMPLKNDGAWQYGEDQAEIWKQLNIDPKRNAIGFIEVGGGPAANGYRIRDARASIFDDYPEIFEETKILMLSKPYPNDMIALGEEFPISAFNPIINGLIGFVNSEACNQSVCASDFYQWDGIQTIDNDFYDVVRDLYAGAD